VTANGADKFWDDCSTWSQHHKWKSYHLCDSLMKLRLWDDGVQRQQAQSAAAHCDVIGRAADCDR